LLRIVANRSGGGDRLAVPMSEPDVRRRDSSAEPYLGAQPDDMRPDLVVPDVWPTDDRLWVPLSIAVDGGWLVR
jgi:hypothetical protein